jgi:hypothetical protein
VTEPGSPVADDYVDPELLEIARAPSGLQLVLAMVIMAFAGYLAWTFWYDAAYYFADETLVEVGSAEALAPTLADNPAALYAYGSNVYAHVSGAPRRESASGSSQFSQLVGAPIYVEQPLSEEESNPLLRDVRPRIGPFDSRTREVHYYVDGNGRFLAFPDLSRRQRGLLVYYRDTYDMWFCGEELTERQRQFRLLSRNELRGVLVEELGRPPTDQEVDDRVSEDFECEHAYLFQLGLAPKDHRWYAIGVGALFLMDLLGLLYMVRWVRRWRLVAANQA